MLTIHYKDLGITPEVKIGLTVRSSHDGQLQLKNWNIVALCFAE
jgi:hypothetical protein